MLAQPSISASARRQPRRPPGRGGIAVLYIIIVMSVMFAFGSLALDFGRVQLAKTELRAMTDSSVRYGVQWVSGGKGKALGFVNSAAADNKVNGQTLTLTSANIEIGNWNTATRVFTANAKPQNAVMLTTSAQVPLALGGPINVPFCTIRASSVAKCVPMGIVGLNSISFKNNTFIGSYDSSVTTKPTQGTAGSNASLVSNGVIGENNNGKIQGDVVIGPSGSVDPGFTVSGGVTQGTTNLTAPSDPAWNPTGNPGGIPAAYTVSSNTNLPGGTYWFTSLTVANNRKLTFTGPATVYVNGNIDFGGNEVTAYNSIPSNLKIYQLGAGRTFEAGGSIVAHIIAPRSDFTTKNNLNFYGCCVFNTITVKNNADFFYDESIGSVTGIALVK